MDERLPLPGSAFDTNHEVVISKTLAEKLKPVNESFRNSRRQILIDESTGTKWEGATIPQDSTIPIERLEEQLRIEYVALKIYERFGIKVPETHLIRFGKDNNLMLVKKYLKEDYTPLPPCEKLAEDKQIREGFLIDVYLDNADSLVNLTVFNNQIHRVNAGRILGLDSYNPFEEVKQYDIDKFKQSDARHKEVYGAVTAEDELSTANLISGLTDQEIAVIVKSANFQKTEEVDLISILIRRRENIKKIYGLSGKQEKQGYEDNDWQNLIEKLSRNDFIDQEYREIDLFEETVIRPWINESATLTEVLQYKPVKEPDKLPDYLEAVLLKTRELTDLEKRLVEKIEKRDFTEEIGKLTSLEKMRMKVSNQSKEKREDEVKSSLSAKIEEVRKKRLQLLKSTYQELHQPVVDDIKNLSDALKEYKDKNQAADNFIADPKDLTKLTQLLNRGKDALILLDNYYKKSPIRQYTWIDHHSYELESLIRNNGDEIMNLIRSSVANIFKNTKQLSQSVADASLSMTEYNDLRHGVNTPLSVFATIPTQDQLTDYGDFIDKIKDFISNYQEAAGITEGVVQDTLNELKRTEDMMTRRITEFRKHCEEIGQSFVVHLTASHSEFAEKILREGMLRSSAGQLKKEKRANVNSPAGDRRPLPEITFSINGAELQYGGTQEAESKKSDTSSDQILLGGNTHSTRHLGVGFIFPYTEVIQGNQFFETGSTQGHGYQHFNELHVVNENYDVSKNPDPLTEIDINKGIFIAPELEKDRWIQFLKEKAGKDDAWIEKHVLFYPEHSNPREFLVFSDISEQLNKQKAQPGILIPTGNLMDRRPKLPLFKWETLDLNTQINDMKPEINL